MVDEKIEKYLVGLNKGQSEVLVQLIDFTLKGKEHGFLIKGYAGTGKTYMLKRFIEFMEDNYRYRTIALTAPTNKAVKIIQSSVGEAAEGKPSRTFKTIHSLLNLKEKIDFKGNLTFKRSTGLKIEFKILIIDEVSMLNDEIFYEVDSLVEDKKVKVIYLGDPAQIPPVGQTDSIPLLKPDMYKIKTVELTEIMRQKKDNKLLKYSKMIRENLSSNIPIDEMKTELSKDRMEGIEFIEKDMNLEVIENYVLDKEYLENSSFFKILAWRNATIDKINKRVRYLMFEDESINRFNVGEKIVSKKPIYQKDDNKKILVPTSSEMTIEIVTTEDVRIYDTKNKEFVNIKMYKLAVRDEDDILLDEDIQVCHEDSCKDFDRLANYIKSRAIKEKSSKLWVSYYDFLKQSSNLNYGYALTVHKS